jgi:hypothetical protein
MDDFSVASLNDSKNEWCARLLNILTFPVIQGVKSISDEAYKLCKDNNEEDKYLMTLQNFLTRVPQWNPTIIDTEKNRITENSGCTYLEELITCVHVIQLKALTCVRVGQKQKKVDIDIPSVSAFVHKIYIHVARKIYTNIYLFEKNIAPLQIQKNNREIELIVKECILNSIRDSIPVETILRAYMDETEEQFVEVKEVEEPIIEDKPLPVTGGMPAEAMKTSHADANPAPVVAAATPGLVATPPAMADATDTKISFSNTDFLVNTDGEKSSVNAPKDEATLAEIAKERSLTIDAEDDEEEDERLSIGDNVDLDITDINDLNKSAAVELKPPVLDFEVLL